MSETRRPVVYPSGKGTWLSFHGIPSRIVASGEETEGTYCVSVGTSVAGGKAPPHSHTFAEGFWISSGTMKFTAGNQSLELGEGGFLHIDGGVAHFPENVSGENAELITFCFPAGFEAFQKEVGIEVPDGERPFPKSSPDIEEKMKVAAPKFGIDLDLPAEAFERDPSLALCHPGAGSIIGVVGDVYRFLVTGKDTDGSYALWHATIFPGAGPPPHTHSREEEFFYVLSGEVTIFDDGEASVATPGTAINLPRGSRHWFRNESDQPAEMLILVAPAGLEKMFQETGRPWTMDAGEPGPPQPDEIARLQEVAPHYGISLG